MLCRLYHRLLWLRHTLQRVPERESENRCQRRIGVKAWIVNKEKFNSQFKLWHHSYTIATGTKYIPLFVPPKERDTEHLQTQLSRVLTCFFNNICVSRWTNVLIKMWHRTSCFDRSDDLRLVLPLSAWTILVDRNNSCEIVAVHLGIAAMH